MDELFASPLKSMPNGVRFKDISPVKSLRILNNDDESETKGKKLYPIFERSAGKRSSSTPLTSSPVRKKRKSTPKSSRKRLPFINSNEQYAIDAGQRDFDATRCKTCNMLYTIGEVTDETTHAEYHDVFVSSLKFNGWKNEDVIQHFEDESRIVRVLPEYARKYSFMHKKIDDVFTVADMELGIRVDLKSSMKRSSVYLLFVTRDKRIAGFVAAESIKTANHLISEEPLIASTEEEPAECGIARLWTHPNYRRQKVASRLLDTLRFNFIRGRVIERSKIAFSDPTNNGIEFAKFYTGMINLLIFQYQPDNDCL